MEKENKSMITYNVKEYLPPRVKGELSSSWVVCPVNNFVHFDYEDRVWINLNKEEVEVKEWRYPEPTAIYPGASLDSSPRQTENSNYEQLKEAFEELLDDRIVIKELKDYWRNRAGISKTVKEVTPQALIDMINSLPKKYSDSCIFEHEGLWNVTNEWLVGTLVGVGVESKTKELAAEAMIEYLNEHLGHDSILGRCLEESGWPDLDLVKDYVENTKA